MKSKTYTKKIILARSQNNKEYNEMLVSDSVINIHTLINEWKIYTLNIIKLTFVSWRKLGLGISLFSKYC